MRVSKALPLLIVLILTAVTAYSETLYKWTDREGVQRYSNQPPPTDVETYETIEGVSEPSSSDDQRPEFTHMLKEMEQEERQNEAQARREALERAKEEKSKAEAERQARIQSERDQLERQMDQIRKRALGPNFTQGMRQAQLDAVQKLIDALDPSEGKGSVPNDNPGARQRKFTY